MNKHRQNPRAGGAQGSTAKSGMELEALRNRARAHGWPPSLLDFSASPDSFPSAEELRAIRDGLPDDVPRVPLE